MAPLTTVGQHSLPHKGAYILLRDAPQWQCLAGPLRRQVEYCFTGEGSDAVPAPTSLRGLDAGIYYRTGSLLNAGHAAVRTLVLDSLRHWAWEYDVDGFCFVNAENIVQGKHPPCKPSLSLSVGTQSPPETSHV